MKKLFFGLICVFLLVGGLGVAIADYSVPSGYPTGDDYIVFKNSKGVWSTVLIDCDTFSWNGHTCGEDHEFPLVYGWPDGYGGIMAFPDWTQWSTPYIYYDGQWRAKGSIPTTTWNNNYLNGFYTGDTLPNDIYITTLNLVHYGTHDYQTNYGGLNITTTPTTLQEIVNHEPVEAPLSFPLDGYTAYNATITSVMDHSMTTPYTKDGIVSAFNGEEGDVDNGCWCYDTDSACNSGNYTSCTVVGFENTGGTNFLDGVVNYDDTHLYYDGHPGYDYPATSGTDIFAPADGVLCVATSNTTQQTPPDVWRNNAQCPLSTVGGTSWSGQHTFYIIHEDLYINGSTDDYMTVFLHSDDLKSSVRDAIEDYGYLEVSKDEHIADVGDFGSSGAYHVHLEVYKKVGESWERVDPYGNGTNNVLWEQE